MKVSINLDHDDIANPFATGNMLDDVRHLIAFRANSTIHAYLSVESVRIIADSWAALANDMEAAVAAEVTA